MKQTRHYGVVFLRGGGGGGISETIFREIFETLHSDNISNELYTSIPVFMTLTHFHGHRRIWKINDMFSCFECESTEHEFGSCSLFVLYQIQQLHNDNNNNNNNNNDMW